MNDIIEFANRKIEQFHTELQREMRDHSRRGDNNPTIVYGLCSLGALFGLNRSFVELVLFVFPELTLR